VIAWAYRVADRLRQHLRARRVTPEGAAGSLSEDLAHRYVQAQGMRVVARNYRPRTGPGEIDLVAWDGDTLVFLEVKTRATAEHGTPDRAVDAEKEKHLRRAAADYARRTATEWGRVRFDVVNVILSDPPRVERIRDAFSTNRKL
jgi:putative endonuclease